MRDEAHQRLFGIDVQLAAEAAADLGRDHAHAVSPAVPSIPADQRAQQVRNLGGGVERQLPSAPGAFGDHAARLHRGWEPGAG